MKMILRTAFAALALATTTMAFADDHHGRDDHDRDRHGHDNRHDDRGRHHDNDWHGRPPPPHYYGNRGGYDHGGYYGRGYDHRPPPPRYYGHWERGHRYYGRNVVVYDYGSYRLRQPPRGYHWVRENNDFLLVALATGVILDIATR